MQNKLVYWFYIIAMLATFIVLFGILIFEVHVRWSVNQNFTVLEGNGIAGLALLLGAQMLGIVWLTREEK